MNAAPVRGGQTSDAQLARKDHIARLITVVFAVCAFAWMAAVAYTRFVTGRWYLADVGNIWYCLFHTLHGQFMFSPMTGANHFAYHFTPFLLGLVWLPLVSDYPIPLVLSYVAAIAACALPIYRLAAQHNLPPLLRPLVVLLFFANHFTGSLELATHFEVFYVLFALCAMAWASHWSGYAFALLAAGVREDGGLWLAAWAALEAFWATNKAQRTRFLQMAVASAVFSLVAFAVVSALALTTGKGFSEYLPRFCGAAFGMDTLRILGTLYASFLFLPLFARRTFVLSLIPAPLLLASFPFLRQLLYYYSYPFLPFMMLATIEGTHRLLTWAHSRPAWKMPVLVSVLLIVGSAIQFQLPTRTDGYKRWLFPTEARDWYRLDVARNKLPRDVPVAIQFGLWGITPTRIGAKPLDPRWVSASDYIFMDLQSPHGLERETFIRLVRKLLDEAEHGVRSVIHRAGDIYILGPARGGAITVR